MTSVLRPAAIAGHVGGASRSLLWNLVGLSLGLPHIGLDYYRRFATSTAYVGTAVWTIGACVFVTACCLVLGYPTALFLSNTRNREAVHDRPGSERGSRWHIPTIKPASTRR